MNLLEIIYPNRYKPGHTRYTACFDYTQTKSFNVYLDLYLINISGYRWLETIDIVQYEHINSHYYYRYKSRHRREC